MENAEMKKCPYCAEEIRAEAVKCRYCGSALVKKMPGLEFLQSPGYWHRVHEGKKIAGVCTGLAAQFGNPMLILPLRVFFIVTCLFYLFGLWLYLILWLLMPSPLDAGEVKPPPAVPTPPDPYRRPAPPVEEYPGQSQAAGQAQSPPADTPEETAAAPEPPPGEKEETGPEGKTTGTEEESTGEEKWGPKPGKKRTKDSKKEEKKDLENF